MKTRNGEIIRLLREISENSQDVVIFMAGLENSKSKDSQTKILQTALPNKSIISHGHKDFIGLQSTIKTYPNSYIVLFSKACDYSYNVASMIKNKSKLFIVEPYASSKNTSTMVRAAVNSGVPSSNVIYGPNSKKQPAGYRGQGVVQGATKNNLGDHFTALTFVGGLIP